MSISSYFRRHTSGVAHVQDIGMHDTRRVCLRRRHTPVSSVSMCRGAIFGIYREFPGCPLVFRGFLPKGFRRTLNEEVFEEPVHHAHFFIFPHSAFSCTQAHGAHMRLFAPSFVSTFLCAPHLCYRSSRKIMYLRNSSTIAYMRAFARPGISDRSSEARAWGPVHQMAGRRETRAGQHVLFCRTTRTGHAYIH